MGKTCSKNLNAPSLHPSSKKSSLQSLKEGDTPSSTVSTVRVENVELTDMDAANIEGGGSASNGFRPIKAEIFTVQRPLPRIRCGSGALRNIILL